MLTCASHPNFVRKSQYFKLFPLLPGPFAPVQTKRAGRGGKRVLQQMQWCGLSQVAEKYMSCCFLPVSYHRNRCCLGTSQHLMQTTSDLNLHKGKNKKKKRKSVFRFQSLPILFQGYCLNQQFPTVQILAGGFFACLFVLERRGL